MQTIQAVDGSLSIDCSLGLTVLHTLPGNIVVQPPVNATPGAVLNLLIFLGFDNHTVSFNPIFKRAGPFSVDQVSFSTVQFVYTGLYWVQLGGPGRRQLAVLLERDVERLREVIRCRVPLASESLAWSVSSAVVASTVQPSSSCGRSP